MKKLKPWLENNNVILAFYITVIAGLFWIFNVYATGRTNTKDINDVVAHQKIHCLKIQEREVFDARLESKLDVILQVYGIDPSKIKTNKDYLSATRSPKQKITKQDKIKITKYIEDLQKTYSSK